MADVSSVGAKLEDTICYAIFRLVFVTSPRCAPANDVYLRSILTHLNSFPFPTQRSSSRSRNYTSLLKYPSAEDRMTSGSDVFLGSFINFLVLVLRYFFCTYASRSRFSTVTLIIMMSDKMVNQQLL